MRFTPLIALLLTSAACGGEDEQPLMHRLEDVGEHIAALRSVVQAHGVDIQGAADLAAVASKESAYSTSAGEHQTELEHELGDMGACHDSAGSPPDVSEMMATLDACADERAAHATAMAQAADLPAAEAEETRHQQVMLGMLDEMSSSNEEMMSMGDAFMCPMHEEGGH